MGTIKDLVFQLASTNWCIRVRPSLLVRFRFPFVDVPGKSFRRAGKMVARTDKSSTIRVLKLSEGVPDGATEVHQRWKYDALALCIEGHVIRRVGRSRIGAEKLKQVRGAGTSGDSFDHDRSEAAIASEQNNCRDGDSASFFGVEEPPSTDHSLLGVTKNWKR
jgi:hypothetical protein